MLNTVIYDPGEKVVFTTSAGRKKVGKVEFDFAPTEGKTKVRLQGDPLPVYLSNQQLTKVRSNEVPTAMSAKQLAKEAKTLGVAGWQEMSVEQLEQAIRDYSPGLPPVSENGTTSVSLPAKKKTATKKAPAKKAVPKVKVGDRVKVTVPPAPSEPAKGASKATKAVKASKAVKVTKKATKKATAALALDNPFRPGCNSHYYVELMKVGGKRSSLIQKIERKINLHPWSKKEAEVDVAWEIDQRLIMTSNKLTELGWTVIKRGRGREGYIQVSPPKRKAR